MAVRGLGGIVSLNECLLGDKNDQSNHTALQICAYIALDLKRLLFLSRGSQLPLLSASQKKTSVRDSPGDSLSVENLSLIMNNDPSDQLDGAVPASPIVRGLQVSSSNSVGQPSRIPRPERAHLSPARNELAHLDESTKAIGARSHESQQEASHDGSTARDASSASDPKLEPDMPLRTHKETDGAVSIDSPEQYVPWIADGARVGILPRIHGFMLTLTFGSTMLIGVLGINLCAICFFVGAQSDNGGQLVGPPGVMIPFITEYACSLIIGTVNLTLILGTCIIVLKRNQIERRIFWTAITLGPVLLGLSIWLYYVLVLNEIGPFYSWGAGSVPQSFRGCDPRVEPQQSMLFAEATYSTQFARLTIVDADGYATWPDFDMELSRSIQTNQTLCAHGFDGNADLYGLGIRAGIYLQWMTCLLANNLLPEKRKELQKVYLVFSLAVCIATIVSSVAVTCVFSIEVEVLHWMYWGGFLSVFATSPSSTQLGSGVKWVGLDILTAIQFTTHALMTYHGVWFIWYAYDQVFARMPCGTYHFYIAPLLDPSPSFWFVRDFLTTLICPLAFPLLLIFPFTALLLTSEIKKSVRGSAIYHIIFPKTNEQLEENVSQLPVLPSLRSRIVQRLRWHYRRLKAFYGLIRGKFSLPVHGRSGIRLITPVDIKDRR